MNILIIVDKQGSAIDRLAQSVAKYNSHFNVIVYPVHPKRNDPTTLFEAQKLIKWADVIDIHYWKSGELLRSCFPTEMENKRRVVCHFNPYDLERQMWKEYYHEIVVGNSAMGLQLPYANYIPYAIDLDFFEFQPEYTEAKTVNMVVGRIEGKKGVREVAEACASLGYDFNLVGRVSSDDYMRQVTKAGGKYLHFTENASEEELRVIYHNSAVHVCNSVDGFESGTLPILEAMACGVPVLTRNIGHVPELFNGSNMIVRKGKDDDIEDLKIELKSLMENRDQRLKIRDRAFQTVKNRNDKKMARQFSKLYYKLLNNRFPLVSIIIPTKDRGEALADSLYQAVNQDYPNCELVVSDSGHEDLTPAINQLKRTFKMPIKYIRFQADTYSLAQARNRAVIEAEGEMLVFCDDRLAMETTAVNEFIHAIKQNTWHWGVKDNTEKAFVENFSAIRREDLIKGGMFLERIDKYGAMSQEIRTRFAKLGYSFDLVQKAHAKSVIRSGNRTQKRHDMIDSKLLLFKLYG